MKRMKDLLGEEYEAFVHSYEKERVQGLRFHMGKGSVEKLYGQYGDTFKLRPIPWCREGFYYDQNTRPGRNPLHEAGLYYIQEPSAMAAVPLLDPKAGERVLDLCAAPGGKTTQIAERLGADGLLVSNEIHPGRAKILSRNVERMGFANTVVTNEDSKRLAEVFPEFFDKLLVDAPCSGEGMFRKDEQARQEWSQENVRLCADRQREILENAARLLRPGGRMVYSTCTFSPEENERQIEGFLERHPEFSIVPASPANLLPGLSKGRTEWTKNGCSPVRDTFRIWPHLTEGEGHYLALLEKAKEGNKEQDRDGKSKEGRHKKGLPARGRKSRKQEKKQEDPEIGKVLLAFFKELLWEENAASSLWKPGERLFLSGSQVYRIPDKMTGLNGIKVLRPGLHLGTLQKNRFEPSHSLAMALPPDLVKRKLCLEPDGSEIRKYLAGEILEVKEERKGWVLVCAGEYSLGWGKAAGGVLKNHYPKGLRIMGQPLRPDRPDPDG